MSGIRTMAAAELLGVSPSILRSWEERFGYPKPRRSEGGQRQYDLAQLESLRRALVETHNVYSAVKLARQRGTWPSSPAQLVDAFRRFDEQAADRVMEESLAVRSVERVVDEVLLPALEMAADREDGDAEFELARRWAMGWLFAALRAAPYASRRRTALLFDASGRVHVDSLRVQAVELGLRRAGICTVLLPVDLPPLRVLHAVRALDPVAFVVCGSDATPGAVARLMFAARQADSTSPLFSFGDRTFTNGDGSIASLGSTTVAAVEYLKAHLEEQAGLAPATTETRACSNGSSAALPLAAGR
jgi:MerR family transcriptional regulator, light-induced transcriptional regulator